MKKLLLCLLILPLPTVCGILVPGPSNGQLLFTLQSANDTSQKTADSDTLSPFFPYGPASQRKVTTLEGSTLSVNLPLLANNPVATNFGFFPGGTTLLIVVSGTVNLGVPAISTLPDGSLAVPVPTASCSSCWAPGYDYFIPGASYPQVAGGDGANHFPGGGGNYDKVADGHSPWAAEGPITTDTTNPQAIRFGEVAGTYSLNPVPNSSDWFAVGSGGTFQVPTGGADLSLVIADTYYSNNTGNYTVTVSAIPEALPSVLVFTGLLLMGIGTAVGTARYYRTYANRSGWRLAGHGQDDGRQERKTPVWANR